MAYNATEEAKAAVHAAADLAYALGADLEIIGVVSSDSYGTPALMGGPSEVTLRADIERYVQESLDEIVATVRAGVEAKRVRLTGGTRRHARDHSATLDLLVTGSRGDRPLRSVLVGGVSGRLMRSAQCPVIVVPRGVEDAARSPVRRRGRNGDLPRQPVRCAVRDRIVARTTVPRPDADSISSVPPTSASRSRIPSSPKPLERCCARRILPVVAHRSRLAATVADADVDPGRRRVLGDVGERLLHDPVDGRLDLRRVAKRRVAVS